MLDEEKLDLLLFWIEERYAIFARKELRHEAPWTTDPILSSYRFCNVHRENDRVTRWIAKYWRDEGGRFHGDPDLWFALVVARLFNNPLTLDWISSDVLPFEPQKMRTKIYGIRAKSMTVFNAAYIVSTNGHAMDKVDYVIDRLLTPLWKARARLRPSSKDTLAGWSDLLQEYDGFAGFMAGQVVADLKYVAPLSNADDWVTFAVSGPGSRRGLNRMVGNALEAGWKEKVWKSTLLELLERVNGRLPSFIPRLHAQDMQNCLCEFDKYCRALDGGRPKQKYIQR